MHSHEVEGQLSAMRKNFRSAAGRDFKYFYCPILCLDEEAELCMGHVINAAIPDSCRARVVQRKDVDGFFGAIFESEFTGLMNFKANSVYDLFANPQIPEKLRPRLIANGEEVHYYHYRGHKATDHSQIIMEREGDEPFRIVAKRSHDEIGLEQSWSVVSEGDFRTSYLVWSIKAAFLTCFRLLGYQYALSTSGLMVGRYVLGRFFEENVNRSVQDVRSEAASFFLPYVHMVRPIESVNGGSMPKGTVEDLSAMACIGSSGRPWATIVTVRANDKLNAVLMPASNHHESVETYLSFLKNDNELIYVHNIQFNQETENWEKEPVGRRLSWPKGSETFDLT